MVKDILNCSFIHEVTTNPQDHKSELHCFVVTSFHQNTTKHSMSDNGEWLEHYYGDTLEDQYDDELPDTASVEEMKEKERAILRAERKVDAQVRDLGGTDLRRPCLYEHATRAWQVRCAVEDEDIEDDDMNDEQSIHHLLKIEKADNCLDVLMRDMKQIEEEFQKDMKFMEKMKRFRSNLSAGVASGAGVANTEHECIQDTASMERMISLVRTIKDYELGLRKRLFSETTQARNSMIEEGTSDNDE
jgi:hypothetical protein